MSGCRRPSGAGIIASSVRAFGVAATAVLAGCSSDVTRFNLLGADFFGTGFAAERPPARPAGYAPDGYGPPGYASPGYASPGYAPPGRSAAHSHGLQETALAPLSPGRDDAYRPPGRDYPPASSYPPPRSEPSARGPDRGPPWSDRSPPPWTDKEPFPWPESSAADRHRPAPGEHAQAWQGRHTLQSGETLYTIARRYKVGVDELKRANGIADESKLWAGKVLSVPGRGGAIAGVATPAPGASTAPPRVVQVTPRVVAAPPPEPEAAPEAPRKTAAGTGGTMTDAGAPPASAAGKFRWPARGKLLVGFGGQQPDGTRSEGINVAVPQGTDIHAADAGRVHYVGDGLKGYGNLILIRHPNGWVSTYAHADQMLVKAGDQVRRGQVIGKAGTSGPVSQPQLRFELRKGTQPVDPLPHLGN
jgi:murein DD-endopeptidase MepM/ murein hydrolase activator NlpD